MKHIITIIATALCLCASVVQSFAQTNLLGIPDAFGSAGATAQQVLSDGSAVFGKLSLSEPIHYSIVGIKNGDKYGAGIIAHQFPSNSIVGIGFGVFAMQTVDAGKKGWDFYDATLNISIQQKETVPIVGWPMRICLETGPAVRLTHEVTVLEQSAAYASIDIDLHSIIRVDWLKNHPITANGGIIHCSDPRLINKVMPFGSLGMDW